MNGFRERSTLAKTGKAFFNLLPVSPGSRIFGIANLLFEFSDTSSRSVAHAKTFNRKLGIVNRLTEIDEFIRVREGSNASAGIVQVRHVTSHSANPVIAVALFHAGSISKVDIEEKAERAKDIKCRYKDTHMLIALIDIHASSDNKAIKQQEEEKLHQGIIAHERHLRRELKAKAFNRFIFRSVKCIDTVSIVHPTHLIRQVLGHLVTTIAHAREGEHLVSQAGTTVESTGNHAFGTILLTFNKGIEGIPVLRFEEVSELEVALFVTDVEFRVVFINRRVEFRTDRDVKVRAVADQSKECKSKGKNEATLKSSFSRLEYTLANACITQTSDNQSTNNRNRPAIRNHHQSGSNQDRQSGHSGLLEREPFAKQKDKAQNENANQGNFNESRNHVDDGAKERTRNPDRNAFDNLFRLSHEEQNEHGRNREHRVKVSAHAKECDVANKDEDTIATRFFTLVVPHETEVRDKHQDEHSDAIDFSFDRVEPERIGEREEESSDESGGTKHKRAHLFRNLFGKAVRLEDRCQKFPGKEGCHIDRCGRTHHGDVVHALCDFAHERQKENDRTGKEHEERRSRRMRNAKRVGASDEFTAVPERDRRGHRHHVNDQSNKASDTGKDVLMPLLVNLHKN